MDSSSTSEMNLLQRLKATPELLRQLESPQEELELRVQRELRRHYDADLVRAAMGLAELRRLARTKFSRADQMWFDRVGLEQATAEAVANQKARRFAGSTGFVWDLCSGIGSDSIAIARAGIDVVSVDRSPLAGLRARWNSEAYGVAARVRTLTAECEALDLSGHRVHIDPDRRAGRQRSLRIEDYSPPLSFLQTLTHSTPGGAIKLSPASNFGGKFPSCEIELISLEGECKEATIWYGDLSSGCAARATLLPSGITFSGQPWESRPRLGPLGRFVFDPDPAIVRSGLLDQVTAELDLSRLDDAEEYLTGDVPVNSPAVKPFEVLADLPHSEKELRRYFRTAAYGEVEIKRRHVPTDIETLRRKLPLSGKDRCVVIVARLAGKTRFLICRRLVETPLQN
jgi:hypothetical protein